MKPTKQQLKDTWKVWLKRAPRPVFAAAIFFAVGEIMNMAGFSMETKQFETASMVKVLADSSAAFFDQAYGTIVAFIGLFGGFITGSEASTIAMFSKYALSTGQNLGLTTEGLLIVAAGLAFGGGLASVISPAKLQNAAASIDKIGEENKVIRVAFVFALILTAVTSVFVLILLAAKGF
jgi:lactate permease